MRSILLRPALAVALLILMQGCGPVPPSISLNQAIEKGNMSAVKQHIAAKTDLNKADSAGWTPIHLAVMKGDLAMVKALSSGGADRTRKGKTGKTALDLAREKREAGIIQYLEEQSEKGGRRLIDGGLGVSESF